jgi:hypothetical protein
LDKLFKGSLLIWVMCGPTSRLQWTAQARFLLGLSLVEAGLAGEIGVKLGQLSPVRWCRVCGLSLGNIFKGRH